jgi:hypothetical protein
MSEIDSYKHECIGIVHCPSSYAIVYKNNSHRHIPLYRLDDDALDGTSFQAKRGDLLLGGGSGESASLRISIPEAISFLINDNAVLEGEWDDFYRAYWTMNEAFVFCEGYRKLGWTPDTPIETWLAEHILAFVLREYPAVYGPFQIATPLEQDGSICHRPTPEERDSW